METGLNYVQPQMVEAVTEDGFQLLQLPVETYRWLKEWYDAGKAIRKCIIYEYMHVYICVYIYMYIYICVYIYIYICMNMNMSTFTYNWLKGYR
jgi:hypothetical protein